MDLVHLVKVQHPMGNYIKAHLFLMERPKTQRIGTEKLTTEVTVLNDRLRDMKKINCDILERSNARLTIIERLTKEVTELENQLYDTERTNWDLQREIATLKKQPTTN